jgi:hypothetical protein
MIITLIKTVTASDAASIDFVDGTSSVVLDNTYDEYMFVMTGINPASDSVSFGFQANASGQSGYNETITSTFFRPYHAENDSAAAFGYQGDTSDQAQGTALQMLAEPAAVGNAADESVAGVLHLFAPSNTTYVKHFYATTVHNTQASGGLNYCVNAYVSGYINVTAAVDEIQFKMSSGNLDGVIQLYGIA